MSQPLQALDSLPLSLIKVGSRFRKDLGDIKGLAESIKKVGLLHPIVVLPKMDEDEKHELIAGVRRLRACEILGWTEIPVHYLDLENLHSGEIEENTVRKDFLDSEIAAIYEALFPSEKKEAQERKKQSLPRKGKKGFQCGGNFPPHKTGKTRDCIGRFVGKSGRTVEKIVAVAKAARVHPEKFSDLMKKLDANQTTVNSAYKKVQEFERQTQLDATLKQKSLVIPENITLFNDDFSLCVDKIPSDSIQLILTDPPYSEEYLEIWGKLGFLANQVLVPGGFLIAYCPHFHLPSVLNSLIKNLEYFWTLALIVPQHRLIHSRHVFCNWKPLVVFNKPARVLPEFFGDVIQGEGMEKELHDWQQAEAEIAQLIETFCPPNGIVLDPMAGTGTTLAVAKRLNRKAVGIEKDPATFEKMKGRLAE